VDNIYNRLLDHIKKIKKQSELEHGMQLSPGGNATSRTYLNFFDYITADGEDNPNQNNVPLPYESNTEDLTFKF
jgi:hypothetical protein